MKMIFKNSIGILVAVGVVAATVATATATVAPRADEEYFVVNVKPYPCDYELQGMFTGEGGEMRVQTEKYHGRFSFASDVNSVTVDRPDLGVTPEGVVSVDAEEGAECQVDYYQREERPAQMVFTHRVEDTLNGKACFKYYNETELPYWFDAEGNQLGREYPDEERGDVGTMRVLFVEVEPFARETFVLAESYTCTARPEVFQPPSEEAFAAECNPAPSPAPSSSSSSTNFNSHSDSNTPVSASTSQSTSGASTHTLIPLLAVFCTFAATLFL